MQRRLQQNDSTMRASLQRGALWAFVANGTPRLWLRLVTLAISGYFLIATTDVSPGNPEVYDCIDGLAAPSFGVQLGALNTEEATRLGTTSCAGYDGLASGVTLPMQLQLVGDGGTNDCHQYLVNLAALPAALANATLVDSSSRIDYQMQFNLSFELPTEPGCRFDVALSVTPHGVNTVDKSGNQHIDWSASAQTSVARTIDFPQIQFCSGALGGARRGEVSCTDTWTATTEQN